MMAVMVETSSHSYNKYIFVLHIILFYHCTPNTMGCPLPTLELESDSRCTGNFLRQRVHKTVLF